ncbi:TetR/AcrR family transcriptional regulator [Halalkalibacter sp. APA_J-10(15)]|uniref:TetR/AcrR family transcriptional regulator n=1 Tax=Halalkalibacter sp. APA_J-10(15) TaxID=2933805 RepID=UPI001FF0EC87|nr:TetR/AcrR family transcriptional regulator [Halalkalibacter sp. APA_J-10(15)]MCK0470011.1 TetR/AcrR family transcriptional regulator [Halalkalibacter sp. APA_J-10(15)]
MMKKAVKSLVKDPELIRKRREQMVKAAVHLFTEKGFHRTTTREIASASGFSIGTLYEYIRTKEDVLFLVCDSIYEEVRGRLQSLLKEEGSGMDRLKNAISSYFQVVHEMQDEVLVMYQETKSLSKDALKYVLEKEVQMVAMIEEVLHHCVKEKIATLNEKQIKLIAHNIVVQGQMWTFRRWSIQKLYNIEEYTQLQVEILLSGMKNTKAME